MTLPFDSKAEGAHARFSPSSFSRRLLCPGSLLLEETFPEKSSSYAEEGTRAHSYGSWLLDPEGQPDCRPDDEDMARHCADYAALVRQYAEGGSLLVERRVNFASHLDLDPEDAFGTSDAVILHDDRITVIDLKYGMGVKVDAENNSQLMLYALGALYEYEALGEYKTVVMVVHQPRLGHVSEWAVPVEHVLEFAQTAKIAAQASLALDAPLNPSDSACRFCKAEAVCPALRREVEVETRDFFANLNSGVVAPAVTSDDLGARLAKVPLIESYCLALRAEAERKLLAGELVEGWKLVEGRKGDRKWVDEEAVLKRLRLAKLKKEQMYKTSLISPATAEKLLKEQPRQWEKLTELTSRADGKPSVAEASDRRPAWAPAMVQGFAALASTSEESEFV